MTATSNLTHRIMRPPLQHIYVMYTKNTFTFKRFFKNCEFLVWLRRDMSQQRSALWLHAVI